MGYMGIALLILNCIATWKLFIKAGEEGWKAIIPFYNEYIYCKLGNCVKLFWADFVLSIISYSGIIFVMVIGIIAAFGNISDLYGGLDYILYEVVASSVFVIIPVMIAEFFILIAKTVLKVFINLKFVSCYTNETVFKVLAGIGSFSPFFISLVVTRCILGFDEKYIYKAPENK